MFNIYVKKLWKMLVPYTKLKKKWNVSKPYGSSKTEILFQTKIQSVYRSTNTWTFKYSNTILRHIMSYPWKSDPWTQIKWVHMECCCMERTHRPFSL